MSRIPSDGWAVQVTHPDTGRTITPDILDDPAILPSLNSLPEVRVPVRKSDLWLDPGFNNDPTMDVWLDGEKQPIDILERVEERQDRTILVGVGATELRNRVTEEWRSERRHIAARNLVTGNTTYAEDVDAPNPESDLGAVQQNPTTNAEFQDLFSFGANDPVEIRNGNIELLQSAHHIEGEDFTLTSTNSDSLSSEGQFETLATDISDGNSVTIDYTIPSANARIALRKREPDDPDSDSTFEGYGFDLSVDGNNVVSFAADYTGSETYSWSDFAIGSAVSGSTSVNIDGLPAGGNGSTDFDLVVIYDDRFTYNFDNTVDANNHLAGPELYPDQFEVESADSQTAFAYVAGELDVTMDDTTGSQRIQMSNDNGQTFVPSDGTEDNTANVDEDFASGGTDIRMRVRFSRYGSGGSSTPTEGFNGQVLNDYTLKADIEFQLLLVDQSVDDALVDVLNEIATSKYIWSANLDANGNYQVSWTQPGQRTAASDPDISDVTISKNADIYDRVTIFGSNKDISDETFTASSTFTALNNTDIVTGSEAVYDSAASTTFDRGDDYEMDYSAGEIRITDGGAMSSGTDYTVDYSVEVSGNYPSGISNPNREFVDRVPGVVSDRGAEQIAYVLQTDNDSPIYSADVQIPTEDVSFDPLDALTLDAFDLPAEATPLETRGEPQVSPTGIQLRLGSRSSIEESLGSISETVASISKRT